MFTDQPPSDMKHSPIYSCLLFIFKHCVKSITAAKPAEAMDGSPRDAEGTKRPMFTLLAYRCNSPYSLLRHNPSKVLVSIKGFRCRDSIKHIGQDRGGICEVHLEGQAQWLQQDPWDGIPWPRYRVFDKFFTHHHKNH